MAAPAAPTTGPAAPPPVPRVEVLAELQTDDIGDLELAGDLVFWMDRYSRSLWAVPRSGGDKRMVARARERPGELAAAPDALYWLEHGRFRSPAGSLKRIALPLAASGPARAEVLVKGLQSPTALQRVADGLWWLDIHHGSVGVARASRCSTKFRLRGRSSNIWTST